MRHAPSVGVVAYFLCFAHGLQRFWIVVWHTHIKRQSAYADGLLKKYLYGRAVAPRPPLRRAEGCPPYQGGTATPNSQLSQWPCQIRLVPVKAPFFQGAKLLIAADCTAYAYAAFHQEFMRGKVTIVGCPKLDPVDYSEKLTEILRENDIKSVTIVRMEVPCCGGLEMAAKKALQESGKFIPWQVVTLSLDGKIIDS